MIESQAGGLKYCRIYELPNLRIEGFRKFNSKILKFVNPTILPRAAAAYRDEVVVAGVLCQAEATFIIRSTASFRMAVDDANEKCT